MKQTTPLTPDQVNEILADPSKLGELGNPSCEPVHIRDVVVRFHHKDGTVVELPVKDLQLWLNSE